MECGNRYSDPVGVYNVIKITQAELNLIKGQEKCVKEVENPFTKKINL